MMEETIVPAHGADNEQPLKEIEQDA